MDEGDRPTVVNAKGAAAATARAPVPAPPVLLPHTMLGGGRYEILEVLGQGGMGAVYKARDAELDRFVALKVIRTELMSARGMAERFKQELLLSRQVTHKNVIRIFDLGESDGMKFITMEYVDGVDLKTYIHQLGKIPPQQAVDIVRHVCEGLDAAHAEGVVHRDLKPQNIMIDKRGKVVVMDFGIAHCSDMPSMTMSGALVGTPEYMSPEQAKGEKADARSDIFSLGIVLYEMLVGKVPFSADSVVETMAKRIQERAVPPVEIDHSVPLHLNRIVVKCLETDREKRYQSVQELLGDLEAFDARKKTGVWDRVRFQIRRRSNVRERLVLVTVLAAAVLSIFLLRDSDLTPVQPRQGMQVLVTDFDSPDFEVRGAIEPMLGLALEGASFISNFDRARARATGAVLQAGAAQLDERLGALVAVREGLDVVISGSISRRGNGYRIDVRAVEPANGKILATARNDAAGKDSLPEAVAKLAASLRTALGDTSPEDVKLALAETLSTSSLEAFQSYAQAQELRSSGKWEEAIRYYTHALQLDPNLGRAYAGIAAAYNNLGQRSEAEKYYNLALAHIDRMTDREKYRTRGGYYLFMRTTDKAIEEFKALVAQYPGDTAGQNNLALSLFQRRDLTGALVQGREFLKVYPRNVTALNNVALYAMYLGDFETTSREASQALDLNPSFVKAYFASAMAAFAQNRVQDAAVLYEKVKSVSPQGAALSSAGLADIALYEGRIADALAVLEGGVAADLGNNERSAASDKLATMAAVYSETKEPRRALEAAERAAPSGNEDSVLFRLARVYVETGQKRKAALSVKELGSKLQAEPRAYAKILEGEALLLEHKAPEALERFRQAQALADTWLGHLDLGRAYLEAGAFAEASSEFDLCLKRRGEATAVFLDDRPTYHLLPQVYYYLGRVQEALKSPSATDWYRTFLSIKQKADKDPLVLDAKKRAK